MRSRTIIGLGLLGACGLSGAVGYHFRGNIRFVACSFVHGIGDCLKKTEIADYGARPLRADVPITGVSGLYTVTPSNDRWMKREVIKRAKDGPDLSLVLETMTSHLDISIVPMTVESTEARAKSRAKEVNDRHKPVHETITSLPMAATGSNAEAHLMKYCRELEAGVTMCNYGFALPAGDLVIEAHGLVAVTKDTDEAEMEELIRSIELADGDNLPSVETPD